MWKLRNLQDKNGEHLSCFRRQFIVENLLFYSTLLQQFISRCLRMDLSAPKNAYMLFRATKVFALPRLRDMLDEGEYSCTWNEHVL